MEILYLNDCYLKEFEATVVSIGEDKKTIELYKTAFYPNAGGQPCDTGKLISGNSAEYNVISVSKQDGRILHMVETAGIVKGEEVKGKIDFGRRYLLMRAHTAAHVLSRVLHDLTGAVTSGNQLGIAESRMDFTLENMDRRQIENAVNQANDIIAKNLPIAIESMSYEDAQNDNNISKLSKHLMPKLDNIRIIHITGWDKQACGGTHLKNTGEIGKIEIVKLDNKGKNNRRIYFRLI